MSKKEKKICEVGAEFYRLYKNQIVITHIIRAEQMPLGHWVYADDFNPYSTSAFKRNFCNRYFKDKNIAEQVCEIKERISALRDEIKQENINLNELLEENRRQILGVTND